MAVDRICREGIEELVAIVQQLRERHVSLVSIQDPWLNESDATTEPRFSPARTSTGVGGTSTPAAAGR